MMPGQVSNARMVFSIKPDPAAVRRYVTDAGRLLAEEIGSDTGSRRDPQLLENILLRKRALSETVNDQLKNLCQIEHTRHRSIANFVVNLLAALAAYTY